MSKRPALPAENGSPTVCGYPHCLGEPVLVTYATVQHPVLRLGEPFYCCLAHLTELGLFMSSYGHYWTEPRPLPQEES